MRGQFKYLFLVLVGVMFLPACTTVCNLEATVASGIGSTIATTLQCTNQAQIVSDVAGLLSKAGLCPALKRGLINNVVCPLIASAAISQLGKVPPASWGCSPANASAEIDTLLLKACSAIPF